MKTSLKQSLYFARLKERKFPSKENTLRVRKIILQIMLSSKNPLSDSYRSKYNL